MSVRMGEDCRYSLDLEEQKKNIFVTQLNEREEDDDVNAFPIVKDSAGKLLETGVNTLQKTLLLKKEVEVDKVEAQLDAKRNEFRKRMESCAERQLELQKKQQKMKDRVSKFDKFIKENEAKRRRAVLKYQQEVKMFEQKKRELEILVEQLEDLRTKQCKLRDRLAKYKKFEEYLTKVIDILPADYLEVQDSAIGALMMRHKTLQATNSGLVDSVVVMTDEVEDFKASMNQAKIDNAKQKVEINGKLSLLQNEMEEKIAHNKHKEYTFSVKKKDMRDQNIELGAIFTAIDNMAEKCWRRTDPNLQTLDFRGKLSIVHKYVTDIADVTRLANAAALASAKRRMQKS
ncbi:DgyrCDS3947 [Dimorphilus gyrociliatus]|uniref:DgyrCDS3947 n=1 Tax=Dimorphilus gyrociliatus TaxID=2664684 RepID=A0A7I8VHK6_9ANNE|nr:DgyrCDS3947 [Dimorphilus gyrociliatus]